MNTKTFKIASISDNKKNAYTAAGLRFFLPERLQATAKVGDYMIVTEKTFTQRTNEQGQLEVCPPWTRQDVTFVGTKKEVLEAASEDLILAVEAKAYVASTVATVSKQYNMTEEALSAVL